jgi:hypothetical protein
MGGRDDPFGCILIFLFRFNIFYPPEFNYTCSHEEAGPYDGQAGQEWCRGVMIDAWYFDCVMMIVLNIYLPKSTGINIYHII